MKALRNYLDKIKPNFEEGGKFHAFQSVFDGFETFLFVPSTTSKRERIFTTLSTASVLCRWWSLRWYRRYCSVCIT